MYTRLLILLLACNFFVYGQQPDTTVQDDNINGIKFYLKKLPDESVEKLYFKFGENGNEKLLLDPGELKILGEQKLLIKNYAQNNNDSLVCVAVGTEFSKKSTLLIVEVASQKILTDQIFNCSDFNISWLSDNKSFSYCRSNMGVNMEGEFMGAIYFHKVGTDASQDTYMSLQN